MTYGSIYSGYVVDVQDPKKLGRCKVRVPMIHGRLDPSMYNVLPWAKYITNNPAGAGRTSFILPKVGDVVWVVFQGGDKDYPLILGGHYGVVKGINEVPLGPDDDYYSTDILYSSGDGAIIKKTNTDFSMRFKDSSITITSDGNIDIKCTGTLSINGKLLNI